MNPIIIVSKYFLCLILFNSSLVVSFTVQIHEVIPEDQIDGVKTYVEHRVTEEDAKKAAKLLQPSLMIGVGCKECTRREMLYCMSDDVIQDHCCCDRKFHEVFPYIEHTCYVTEHHCSTLVPNCGEYSRILNCCCHKYLGAKWKGETSGASRLESVLFLITLVLSTTRLK